MTVARDADVVRWHDLECGGYVEDLPLWRELAAAARGPVLDVGAGTGRVSLDLAARGHDVTALDVDPVLLRALAARAARRGLDVPTVAADARAFEAGRRFHLIIVPMQTLQLLEGEDDRARFYACARAHLVPGGVLAAALADALEAFDEEHTEPPLPDMREIDGVLYASRPVAVRDAGPHVVIERIRETVDPAGRRTAEGNAIRLARVDGERAAQELRAAGLAPLPPRAVAQTEEYVGSTVVMARG